MRTLRSLISALAVAGGLASFAGGPAAGQAAVEIGVLTCSVASGAGFVIGSSKRLDCMFQSGNEREPYVGRIEKFGLDIGVTGGGVITWAVLAPTRDAFAPGVLAGGYGGVSGEATLGLGVGANALIGGSRRTITLQPLSVSAQQGLNLALGVTALTLEPAY